MATRKKKEEVVAEVPAKKLTPIPKREKKEPKVFKATPLVVKGSHLTVTTHPNGRTELTWDDEQLLKEVREAIATAELAALKPAVRAKAATRKKKENSNL
jgi:YD repeat-containing protein